MKRLMVWTFLLLLVTGCTDVDTNPTLDATQDTNSEQQVEAVDPQSFYRTLIDQYNMPVMEIGDVVRLQSDTSLFVEPAYTSSTIQYLQNIEVEIVAFNGPFARVRTVSFYDNKSGWIPLWSLYPDSHEMEFYRGQQLVMAGKNAFVQIFPLEGIEPLSIQIEENQPLMIRRVYGDYFEVSFIDASGETHHPLWIRKSDTKSYDPDVTIQGLVRYGAEIQVEGGEVIMVDKPIHVWLTGNEGQRESLLVRLPDHRQGEIKRADLIRDPFASLHTYEGTDAFMLWHEQYLPESVEMPLVFRIYTNQEMDQASVERSIRQSFTLSSTKFNSLNDATRTAPNLRFNWVSDRDVFLYVDGLAETADVMFHLFDAYTTAGDQVGTTLRVVRSKFHASLMPDDVSYIHRTSVDGLAADSLKFPAFWDYRFVENAQEFEEVKVQGENTLVIYTKDSSQYVIINLESMQIDEIPKLSSLLEEAHSFFPPEMIADRWSADAFYVLANGSDIYLYQYTQGTWEKIYSTTRPIYGFAVSPDQQQIALIESQEENFAVMPGNLVIIDQNGNELFREDKIVRLSASDGVYFIADVHWVDNHKVSFQTEFPPTENEHSYMWGEATIHLSTGHVDYAPMTFAELDLESSLLRLIDDNIDIALSDEWLRQLITRYDHESITYQWSPDKSHLISSIGGQLFLYEDQTNEWSWIGSGNFVQWVDSQTFIWMQGYRPFYNF